MIRLLLLVSVLCKVQGQLVPLIYAAPSAVSHQSRIDIRHDPGFISAPLIYSPATSLYTTNEKAREAVITPVFTADAILTPVALSFFHNLPLARALEHPISIDKMQQENEQNDERIAQNMDSVTTNDKESDDKVKVTSEPENQEADMKQKIEKQNYVISAYNNNEVTTDKSNTGTTEYGLGIINTD